MRADVANSLPQSAGDCKPFNWCQIDHLLLSIVSDGGVVLSVIKVSLFVSKYYGISNI